MVAYVDTEAGFAIFREGRSLCIRLQGTLHQARAVGIADAIGRDELAVRLRLECSSLDRAEAAGARILAGAVLAWTQRRDDRSVDVLNLDPGLERSVAWHPLRALSNGDELLFFDPDLLSPWGAAALPASRH